ncbi:hypothetical protein MPTK1_6g12740 [Marchantia polymorpha subsp. ruderalis]|uniref:Uncharacterized protein n=2 Tax=Marchantia polymorpha TaxID=3197 RepID=A0AAF6BRD9_MARPO|nr:hypothetical protein MARPO_0059s0073 [Marchantia polymorpha]BBN14573.1 hypothetical protein Mp_6g12740 [Marchantia polymorpha subsp. ruderalis]|eukprot:PTQ37146.1 hypothetical protein MARPO_0059s0073 [Marchantia polymorpha]
MYSLVPPCLLSRQLTQKVEQWCGRSSTILFSRLTAMRDSCDIRHYSGLA